MLLGHSTERIVQFGHDQLPVFGIGAELNETQWRKVMRQLVALGHLQPNSEDFGALKLTASARDVLKGERNIMLREETNAGSGRTRSVKAKIARRGAAFSSASRGSAPDSKSYGGVEKESLLGALRAWRSSVALKRGVPAYVVLHDATLEGIASSRPKLPTNSARLPASATGN